jgi:hypothetical protein
MLCDTSQELFLNNNLLHKDSFPHSFAALEMRFLTLEHNHLTEIPSQVTRLRYLTSLDLRYCTVVPRSIAVHRVQVRRDRAMLCGSLSCQIEQDREGGQALPAAADAEDAIPQ